MALSPLIYSRIYSADHRPNSGEEFSATYEIKASPQRILDYTDAVTGRLYQEHINIIMDIHLRKPQELIYDTRGKGK
jgi:hypothetical protein